MAYMYWHDNEAEKTRAWDSGYPYSICWTWRPEHISETGWVSVGFNEDEQKWECWSSKWVGDTQIEASTLEEAKAVALMMFRME